MRPTRFHIGCLALATILASSACGDDEEGASPAATAAETEPAQPKTEAKLAAAPAPQATAPAPEPPVWSYSPIGKRDPFRSYLEELGSEDEPEKKLEPTEEFELDQYRLTGLITGTAQPKAMVEDPKKRGHTLRIGTRLGKNGGRVTRITSVGIVVTEEFRAPTGERVRVPIQILLPKPELELTIEP